MSSQFSFNVRCEWGESGIRAMAAESDVLIIVDVLSFSTTVDIATSRGAEILPFKSRDAGATALAQANGAVLAGPRQRRGGTFSISPASMVAIGAGIRLVLPSPNGGALSLAAQAAGHNAVLAGCLRNCGAIARYASNLGPRLTVVPAGERWKDNSIRFALEDWLGAGAIISLLPGTKSPEAQAAAFAFQNFRADLAGTITRTESGQELVERGFEQDVAYATQLDVSKVAPRLVGNAYVQQRA